MPKTTALLLLLLLTLATTLRAAERPNIVFLFTDDQAPWAMGAAGHPHAITPNMDRLVREGAYLRNAFTVTPVCSPSRASLMTSRYGTELGITEWIHPRKEPKLGLDPKTVTWPEVLQKQGYATGLVGKWHLGVPDRFHPTKTGFDYFMGFRTGGNVPKNPTLEKDGKQQKFKGFLPDILTDHALEFIRKNKDGPFLLCLHYRAPHARWLPVPEDDWAPFKNLDPKLPHPDYPKLDVKRVKRVTREYLASVKSVDTSVGRILKALDEMRPNMYDTSIRVPTIVRWPGHIKPSSKIDETISNLDWYPTILAMTGAKPPAGETIRGRNFLPLLEGNKIAWENDFYAQYSTHHQTRTQMRMYRTGDWKLIRDFLNSGRDELYDLKNDPEERKNLIGVDSAEVKEVIAQLHAKLLAKMREIDDPALP